MTKMEWGMTKLSEETKGEGKRLTPLRAIRLKCLDCAYTSNEVDLCPCVDCPLYRFRFGKNPNVQLSEEERERRSQMARENLAFTQHIKSVGLVGDDNGG